MDKKTEEFFDRLKGELEKSNTWPAIYLFKFIVPTDNEKIKQVELAFDGLGAVIKQRSLKPVNLQVFLLMFKWKILRQL